MKIKGGIMGRLLATDDSPALLFNRLAMGIAIFPHGAQKTLGWFGGPGFHGSLTGLSEMIGIPLWLSALVIFFESVGSIAITLGFFTRLFVFGLSVTILTCAVILHLPYGFFMDWAGEMRGEGIEYHVLFLGLALALVLKGGGFFSVDRALTK